MSDTFRPASSRARLAACAFKPSPDIWRTRPISDSPTPTMAILFLSEAAGFICLASCLDSIELRNHGAVATILEGHADPIANANRQRIVPDDVRHHARSFIEFDQCDDIGRARGEGGDRRAMDDRETVDRAGAIA